MPGFGIALVWMIICPVAFFTDLISILIILHYKPLYHSCDIAFISILVTMATNSWLLLPLPAMIKLSDSSWNKGLCMFYTWLSVMLRSSHLLVLLVLNVYWMASLRMSPKGKMFTSSKPMKASVGACWFISAIAGLMPVAGGTEIFHFYDDEVCKFLPTNISAGFAVFFVITSLLSAVMGFISTLDTLLVLRSMKEAALIKYRSSRLHIATVSGSSNMCSQVKYNELDVSEDLCRLVLCFSVSSAALNALPLLVSQFIQLTQDYDREKIEVTLLWLLLIESLTLPHILWLLSNRYRHAAVYTWRVFVVRDKQAKEEDSAACTLQAYRSYLKNLSDRPYVNSVRTPQVNGNQHGPGKPVSITVGTDGNEEASKSRTNGAGQGYTEQVGNTMTTDLDDGLTVLNHPTSTEVVTLHDNRSQASMYAQIRWQHLSSKMLGVTFSSRQVGLMKEKASFKDVLNKTDDKTSLKQTSSMKSPLNTPSVIVGEIQRSSYEIWPRELTDDVTRQHFPVYFHKGSDNTEKYSESDNDKLSASDNISSKIPCDTSNNIFGSNCIIRNDLPAQLVAHNKNNSSDNYINSAIHPPLGQAISQAVKGSEVAKDEDNVNVSDSLVNKQSYMITSGQIEPSDGQMQLLPDNDYVVEFPDPLRKDILYPIADSPHPMVSYSKNINKPNSQETSVINVQKYARIVGVYYDDTHTIKTTHNWTEHNSSESNITSISSTPNTNRQNETLVLPKTNNSSCRKFISNSNLVISKIDDDLDENCEEIDEKNVYVEKVHSKFRSEQTDKSYSREGQEQLQQSTEFQCLSKTLSPGEPNNRANGSLVADRAYSRSLTQDALLEYGKLENVSRAEMLYLKMKSVRAAMAVYSSDDATSDRADTDDNSFDDDTCDDNEF